MNRKEEEIKILINKKHEVFSQKYTEYKNKLTKR